MYRSHIDERKCNTRTSTLFFYFFKFVLIHHVQACKAQYFVQKSCLKKRFLLRICSPDIEGCYLNYSNFTRGMVGYVD